MSRIQRYVRATSVEEAAGLKQELGATAFYLAGGTDALVFTPENATVAIDVTHLGLDLISARDGVVEIGATTLLRDIERNEVTRDIAGGAFREAIQETGPWLIRNQATLAGNICNASPSADSAPMLLALDAEIMLSVGSVIAIDQFFTGPHRTALTGQLVTAIRIRSERMAGHFHKLSRSKSDVAQVNLAITAQTGDGVLRNVRVALGSVAPTPMRARRVEALLEGQRPDGHLISEASALVREEVTPIDDWRATASFRRHAAGVMVARGLASLGGNGAGELRASA